MKHLESSKWTAVKKIKNWRHYEVLNINKKYFICRGEDEVSYRTLGPQRIRLEIRILHPQKIETVRGKVNVFHGEEELSTSEAETDSHETKTPCANHEKQCSEQVGDERTVLPPFPGVEGDQQPLPSSVVEGDQPCDETIVLKPPHWRQRRRSKIGNASTKWRRKAARKAGNIH